MKIVVELQNTISETIKTDKFDSMVLCVVNNYNCHANRDFLPLLLNSVMCALDDNFENVTDFDVCLVMAESIRYWIED